MPRATNRSFRGWSLATLLLTVGCATGRAGGADAPAPRRDYWPLDRWEIGATAGAGFSGLRIAEVLEHPAYRTCVGCRDTLIADSVDLIANQRYSWRPALSTGLVAYAYTRTLVDPFGLGLGVQMVFVPDIATGSTSPFPAITLHAGIPGTEVFAGVVLGPTDGVALPDDSIRVARAATSDYNRFILRNTGRSEHLYFGIQIRGTRQNERDVPPPPAPDLRYMVNQLQVTPSTVTVAVNGTQQLTAVTRNPEGVEIRAAVTFRTLDPAVATVDASGLVRGVATGTTSIVVVSGGHRTEVPVTVQ